MTRQERDDLARALVEARGRYSDGAIRQGVHGDHLDAFDRLIAQVRRDAARDSLDGFIADEEEHFLSLHVKGAPISAAQCTHAAITAREYRDTHYPEEARSEHMVSEDGDADWGAIWDRGFGLAAERDALAAQVERVRALTNDIDASGTAWARAEGWAVTGPETAAYEHALGDVLRALDGEVEG